MCFSVVAAVYDPCTNRLAIAIHARYVPEMKLRRSLKWIGMCGIGLLLGLIVGCVSQGVIELFIPFDPGKDYNPDTSYPYGERMHYLGLACFAWSTAACLAILGSRRARFHLLFGHGLAFLCVSLYITINAVSILRLLTSAEPFQTHLEWEQFKILEEYKQYEVIEKLDLALFFLVIGLVMLMAALIADRSEQERQKDLRRHERFLH
jgi:asparagine N-glycosylation enzyme membrane subunit Stt3